MTRHGKGPYFPYSDFLEFFSYGKGISLIVLIMIIVKARRTILLYMSFANARGMERFVLVDSLKRAY